MPDSTTTVPEAPRGRVSLLADNPRDPEIVFDFPFHEELNEAVKELPGRWFDWRRKQWRVPARPRVAKAIEALLARFPDLVPSPEVLSWLSDSDRWRAVCTVVARDGIVLEPSARFQADVVNVGPGQRYDVIWPAREPGKWIFHCHIPHHTLNNNVEEQGAGGLTVLVEVSP